MWCVVSTPNAPREVVFYSLGFSGTVIALVVIMLQRGDYYLLALPISNLCFAIGYKLEKSRLNTGDKKGGEING